MPVKLETVRNAARAEYAKDEANAEVVYPYSPARATKALGSRKGYPAASRLIGLVAEVYYAENGSRSPLPKSAAKGTRSFASAVRKRRDAGGRLGRWEVIAASAAETLGRPVSVPAVRAAYLASGGDLDSSYTGRGTRVGAPATRESETAELALADES
jgi:hypothetical protein